MSEPLINEKRLPRASRGALPQALKQVGGERQFRQLSLLWPDIDDVAERLSRHLTLRVPGPDGQPLLAAALRAGLRAAAPHRHDLATATPLITFLQGLLEPLPALVTVAVGWPPSPVVWDPLADGPLESLCRVAGPPRIERVSGRGGTPLSAVEFRLALATRLLDARTVDNIGGDLVRLVGGAPTAK